MNAVVFTLTLLMTLFAAGARADCSNVSCENVYVEQLYADSGELGDGDIWIHTSGTETALNCTPSGGVWLKLSSAATSSHQKEVYALLMMAFSMDKPVNVRIMPGADCVIAYVTVNR